MATEEQEGGRGFRVQDRRRFSQETGEPRVDENEQKLSEETHQKERFGEKEEKIQESHAHSHEPLSFSSFVLGFITQALMFMGEVPSPQGHQTQVDLSAARQVIDLLAMLKQKTKGNLDSTEDKLLEDALFDLRMRYVQLAKS